MYELFFFLHVLAAVAVGFYLLFPLAVVRVASSSNMAGAVGLLGTLNRIGQYILIVAFLTGGYMVSQVEVSVFWMIAAVVLILAMFALAGMSSKPLKRWQEHSAQGGNAAADIGKVKTFSMINALCLLALVVIMVFPNGL